MCNFPKNNAQKVKTTKKIENWEVTPPFSPYTAGGDLFVYPNLLGLALSIVGLPRTFSAPRTLKNHINRVPVFFGIIKRDHLLFGRSTHSDTD